MVLDSFLKKLKLWRKVLIRISLNQTSQVDRLLRRLLMWEDCPIKNYEPLIEAIKIIKDGGINVNLTIVGEPTLNVDFKYQEKLVKMVKDIGIEERIKFVGKITNNDLPNYYRKIKFI